MRSLLSWTAVPAAVLILSLVPGSGLRSAQACTVGPAVPPPQPGECYQASIFPESDVVPANLGAFHVRLPAYLVAFDEPVVFKLVQGSESTILPAEQIFEEELHAGSGMAIMAADVTGLLTEGPATLQVHMPCRPAPDEDPDARRTEVQEFTMTIGDPLSIASEPVSLRVNEQGRQRVRLPHGGSCSMRQRARLATISARVPAELEPWRDVLLWRTEVRLDAQGDFVPWRDSRGLGENLPYGHSRTGAGQDRLWSLCESELAAGWNRISEVRMVATLPGTDQELRTETRRIDLECKSGLFACTAAPAPTPGPWQILLLAGLLLARRRRAAP